MQDFSHQNREAMNLTCVKTGKHAGGVQCECVRDSCRWNADHAGTSVWQGQEHCHGNITQCKSSYHLTVRAKRGGS